MKDLKEETFFEFYDSDDKDNIVSELDGYSLVKVDLKAKGFLYKVYDPDFELVTSWRDFTDIEKVKNLDKSPVYKRFIKEVDKDLELLDDEDSEWLYDEDDPIYGFNKQLDKDNKRSQNYNNMYNTLKNKPASKTSYTSPWNDDYDDWWSYGDTYYSPQPATSYKWKEPDPIDIEPYCKSDTLVMHLDDPSTEMLKQVYEGKGWDVIRKKSGVMSDKDLQSIVDRHDRLVFLGHGTSGGLIGFFGGEMAKHIEGKKVFAIWCNADAYFKQHNIGKGQFVTGNMPSEVWECSYAGCGKISKELMLENITYWSKLCAEKAEACIEGNVKSSVDYIRKKYLEKYGNHPVSIYNANRTQCLGEEQPLPKYKFKGKPLGEADIPYPGFDEKEFLKNPTESIPVDKTWKSAGGYYSNYYNTGSTWNNKSKDTKNDGIVSDVRRSTSYYTPTTNTNKNPYTYYYNTEPHDSKNDINVKTRSKEADDIINSLSKEAQQNLLGAINDYRTKDNFINLYDAQNEKAYYVNLIKNSKEITDIREVDINNNKPWYLNIKKIGYGGTEPLHRLDYDFPKTPEPKEVEEPKKEVELKDLGKDAQDQITQMEKSFESYPTRIGWAYDPDKDLVFKAVFVNGNLASLEEEKTKNMIDQVKQAYEKELHGIPANAEVTKEDDLINGPGNTKWKEVSIDQYLDELEKEDKDNPPKK